MARKLIFSSSLVLLLFGCVLSAMTLFTQTAMAANVIAPTPVRVTIENLSPVNGTYLTPVWVGFHNGGFDIFDSGLPASGALERLAEDGNTTPISGLFTASLSGNTQGTIAGPGGALAPGDIAKMDFMLTGTQASNRYFSFASMVIPSNDAFIANDNPITWELFDSSGKFVGTDFFILGSMIYDAGTEVNTELPAHTAFFGQTVPNTGIDENGVVHLHPGYLPFGSGGILDDFMFRNADFTRLGYPVAQIRVELVPIPGAVWLFGSGLVGLIAIRRRSRQ